MFEKGTVEPPDHTACCIQVQLVQSCGLGLLLSQESLDAGMIVLSAPQADYGQDYGAARFSAVSA